MAWNRFALLVPPVALVALIGLGSSAASAADLELPVDTVIEADAGSLVELGRVPVDTGRAGPLCTWSATVINQESSHSGNDILVTSGDTTLVLAGVEDTANKVTTNTGSVYLSDEVVVTLRMGPDEIFSGGLELDIRYDSCVPAPAVTTPTTAPEPEGPTTVAPTTIPTTVTSPPPAGPDILPVSGPSRLAATLAIGLSLTGAGVLLTRGVRSRVRGR